MNAETTPAHKEAVTTMRALAQFRWYAACVQQPLTLQQAWFPAYGGFIEWRDIPTVYGPDYFVPEEVLAAASGAPQEAPGDAPSDSQMLDWLAQRKHSFEFSTPGDHIANKAWLVTLETGKSDRYGPICTEFDGDTLRDCISAAMKGPQ